MSIYKLVVLFLIMGLNLACKETEQREVSFQKSVIEKQDSFHTDDKTGFFDLKLKEDSSLTYQKTKKDISQIRFDLSNNSISEDSLSNLFTDLLVNKIIPYWYQTKWSFEGHTAQPKKGEIACGYFVSTTLKDMGLNINRYKLAQQSPINEARTLSLSTPVIEINKPSTIENINELKLKMKEGIYFIGFDQSHVGYILKKNDRLYLIHSNYINSKGVEIEVIEESVVFSSYNKFYLVELSTNRELLKTWINQTKIEVLVSP